MNPFLDLASSLASNAVQIYLIVSAVFFVLTCLSVALSGGIAGVQAKREVGGEPLSVRVVLGEVVAIVVLWPVIAAAFVLIGAGMGLGKIVQFVAGH